MPDNEELEQVETVEEPAAEETTEVSEEAGVQPPTVPDSANLDARFAEYDRKIDEANRRAEFFQQLAIVNAQKAPQQPVPDEPLINENEVALGSDVERIVNRRMAPIQSRLEQSESRARMSDITTKEQLVRAQNPDYDDVINRFASEIFRKNKGMYEAVMASENPAQLGYNIGITHPDYQKSKNKQGAPDAASIAEKNLGKPQPLAATGGKQVKPKDFASMSDEEFEKEVQLAKGLVR